MDSVILQCSTEHRCIGCKDVDAAKCINVQETRNITFFLFAQLSVVTLGCTAIRFVYIGAGKLIVQLQCHGTAQRPDLSCWTWTHPLEVLRGVSGWLHVVTEHLSVLPAFK